MADKTEFFRIATAGATTDGREIDADWLDQIVENFNPATLGVRINMEHIHGYSAEPPFCAYGDVVAVKVQTDDIELGGKTEKRKALYAQIEPTQALIELNRARQKIYTSCEIRPNFAGTGKAGLVGLAVTDNPASLGTSVLKFAAEHPDANPFAARKQQKDDLFSEAAEATLVFAQNASDPTGIKAAIIAGFKAAGAMFGKAAEPEKPVEKPTPANDNAFDPNDFATKMGSEMAKAVGAYAASTDARVAALDARFGAMETKLASTEAPGFSRQTATGGGASHATDC